MKTETMPWDSAAHLETKEDVAAYLDAVFAEGDPALVAHALGVVARARGMSDIARAAGVSRASLYQSLRPEGNPELATIMKVMNALGVRLGVGA